MAIIPDGQLEAVIESAEECPGECIFIEAGLTALTAEQGPALVGSRAGRASDRPGPPRS